MLKQLVSYQLILHICSSVVDSQRNTAALESLEVPLAVINRDSDLESSNNSNCHCNVNMYVWGLFVSTISCLKKLE